MIGIYAIRCLVNNRIYVGASKQLLRRWSRFYWHIKLLNRGVHYCRDLQNNWTEFGPEHFSFEIIEECAAENLIQRETFYRDSIDESLLYNSSSEEASRNRSLSHLGKSLSEESRRKGAETRRGSRRSEATKERMREAWVRRKERGWQQTKEARKKMSESRIKSWQNEEYRSKNLSRRQSKKEQNNRGTSDL